MRELTDAVSSTIITPILRGLLRLFREERAIHSRTPYSLKACTTSIRLKSLAITSQSILSSLAPMKIEDTIDRAMDIQKSISLTRCLLTKVGSKIVLFKSSYILCKFQCPLVCCRERSYHRKFILERPVKKIAKDGDM